ncbi:MAG: Lipoprotein signal peptidase [Candidatus Moranbacteria bacterium GW2011_GWF2_34_56]|nr:MAG: Lipoprotein signal peptidase [Candidatus Moranbacteria bacterium GW2011_GWF1_34_10]KKP63804.1 MAG: Lipoprotein signal peptidase [Candidatus Moranbacteria bacterium GW2011_GWF2_34_56]HBI16761.1 hypothetical protein [Candidatus Moranbacteria bacterium]
MKEFKKKYNFLFLISLLAGADQLFKYLIRHYDGFYICNPGISFGFLMPSLVFYLIVGAFFVLSFLYIWGKISIKSFPINKIGLSFILGGALANLADRYNYGCIIDFIDLGFFPVFNLADIFITIGAIMIIMKSSKNNS